MKEKRCENCIYAEHDEVLEPSHVICGKGRGTLARHSVKRSDCCSLWDSRGGVNCV